MHSGQWADTEGRMTSPANKSKTKSPKSPGLLSRLNCASGKSGKTESTVPLTMAPATPPDLSRSYAEDPGEIKYHTAAGTTFDFWTKIKPRNGCPKAKITTLLLMLGSVVKTATSQNGDKPERRHLFRVTNKTTLNTFSKRTLRGINCWLFLLSLLSLTWGTNVSHGRS